MTEAFTTGLHTAAWLLAYLAGAATPTAGILALLYAAWWALQHAQHQLAVQRIRRQTQRAGRHPTSDERWATAR